MFNLLDAILLGGGLAVIVAVIPAVRRSIRDHNRNAAMFRDYFGPEYDRDLLQQSAFGETEEWLADHDSRLPSFRLRDLEGHGRR